YVVKPFSPRELAARVRVILRRFYRTAVPEPAPVPAAAPAAAPGFTLDTDGARVSWLGHALDLTRYEFGMLALLVQHPGRIYSREQLMDLVWHEALDSADRTVDTHIKTLRAKLRAIDPERDPIRTHRGMGYSLQP
ncbi:MAG: winged helix-turn-helix domain-containing protein, partial [Burkholderia sp.]